MRLLRLSAVIAGAVALAAAWPNTEVRAADGDWVTIKGLVKMTQVPKPKPINVTVDQKHCLMNGPLFSEDVIVNPNVG